MRKFYFLLSFLCVALVVKAQNDRYWVGASGGAWTNSSNWSLTAGGAGGAGAPTSLQNAIFDGYVGSVNFDAANITINALKVINSADVTVSIPTTTSRTLTINDGLATNQDLRVDATSKLTLTTASGISALFALAPNGALVDGLVILKGSVSAGSGGRIDASNATVSSPVEFNGTLELHDGSSNTTGTNFKFNAGSFYLIKKNGGNIPAGVWDANAEIQYLGIPTGSTTSSPTFNGPPAGGFGRFIYNVTNQSQTINLSLSSLGTIFNGDFRVVTTNGQILRLATTLSNVLVKGNFVVQSGAIVSMTNSNTAATGNLSMTVNGNLQVGGSFDLQENAGGGNSYLKLKGGMDVTGTLKATGNGTTSIHEIEFTGTSVQPVSVSGTVSGMPQFKVNGAGLLTSTNVSLPASTNAKLTLTAGNINTGSFVLYVQNPSSAAIAGGTASSHVIGKLRRATNTAAVAYIFPVSSSESEVAPVKIYPAAGTGTDYQVQFIRPNPFPRNQADRPAGINNISNFYWDISRPSGSLNADLNFGYGGLAGFTGATDPATVKVVRWNGATPWELLGGTDAGGNSVDVAGVSSFTQFALGSPANEAPLPAALLSFSALRQGNAVNLKWTVAQEQDVAAYELQRSNDGQRWNKAATVNSLGSTTTQRAYHYNDNGADPGKLFYRLATVGKTGSTRYSNVVIVAGVKASAFALAEVFPNPVRNLLTVQLQAGVGERVQLSVVNSAGRIVAVKNVRVESGTNAVDLRFSSLPAGVYTLRAVTETGERSTRTVVKQ